MKKIEYALMICFYNINITNKNSHFDTFLMILKLQNKKLYPPFLIFSSSNIQGSLKFLAFFQLR